MRIAWSFAVEAGARRSRCEAREAGAMWEATAEGAEGRGLVVVDVRCSKLVEGGMVWDAVLRAALGGGNDSVPFVGVIVVPRERAR